MFFLNQSGEVTGPTPGLLFEIIQRTTKDEMTMTKLTLYCMYVLSCVWYLYMG